ncbi:hypothetical protein O181_109371 [Austropuccinia psidii MF-1]|uniref:CCHC-type domain-containing protein n=1 Tax=Austropuccinia psidii MF-1 TaxID=1389203 RepID=A0A9Q3JWM1_9BASI|nr:hypothetical protein [Austropuccinia psidii MF-1]
MSDTMINIKILRKCGGELEHAIKIRCMEPCSTEDYINAMEDIITRTRIDSQRGQKTRKPVLKCHKCGSTSHLANTCTKKTKINEVQVIEEVHCTEEKEESDQDSAISEDTPVEDYPIENIKAFFEVTEVHTHLPQYSANCYNLINIQDARMCQTKPAKGKGYTAGACCITSVLIKNIQVIVNLDTGAFCTCVGKDCLQVILPEWKNHLLPIEVSSKNDTHKEEFVSDQLVEAHINPSLSPKMRNNLIDVLYTYNNAFASNNEPLGAITGHEVDITLNIDRAYPPVLRRPAYPATPRAREALELK